MYWLVLTNNKKALCDSVTGQVLIFSSFAGAVEGMKGYKNASEIVKAEISEYRNHTSWA